jgi:hypothetical protein
MSVVFQLKLMFGNADDGVITISFRGIPDFNKIVVPDIPSASEAKRFTRGKIVPLALSSACARHAALFRGFIGSSHQTHRVTRNRQEYCW